MIRIFFKPFVLSIALCFLTAGYFIGRSHPGIKKPENSPDSLVAVSDQATPLKPGPWGNLEALPVNIEPPEELLPVEALEEQGRLWNFAGCSGDALISLFNKADLTADQRTELLDITKWEQSSGGIIVKPSAALIFSLSENARRIIYTALWRNPASGIRGRIVYFRAGQIDELFKQSGLSTEIEDLFKKLSFRHGEWLFCCDLPWILDKIPKYEDKLNFIKTITRRPTLLLYLHVTADSKIDSLVNYWAKSAWGKDIKPMLESLAKVPGGARIDIVHFIPPMPASCLYSFPLPSANPIDSLKDCHWVALNFFRDPPDLSLTDHEKIKKIFDNDYYPVRTDPRYGDLVLLVTANGDVIHSAVFIADDIVYTKNGPTDLDPYMLMRFQTMIDAFSAFSPDGETLRIKILRNKYY